jgi:NAD(P)-dependent dehydrogenase (short-subunit alcohol dehydrogenase family)
MLEQRTGRIVEIASVTGTTAWPLVSATSLAKTALIRHVENLAATCADRDVCVFALHPGIVRTELLLSYRSDPSMAAVHDSIPDQAFSPPELAARVVARIATGAFDALSGRFVDATADLDVLTADPLSEEALRLRLAP